jgi:hypothetical protein
MIRELEIQAQDRVLITVQSQILKFVGHVIRRDGIEKDIIRGKNEGKRSRGRLCRPNQDPRTNDNVRKHPEYREQIFPEKCIRLKQHNGTTKKKRDTASGYA